MKLREKDLLKLIVDYCEIHKILYVRNNPVRFQSRRQKDGSYKTWVSRSRPSQLGSPDLFIYPKSPAPPKFLGVETKRPGEKQSDEQRSWEERITLVGGAYVLIDSLDEADKLIRSLTAEGI